MDYAARRHALALNEVHAVFGDIEKLTHAERMQRLDALKRLDHTRPPKPEAVAAVAAYAHERERRRDA
jgi:hypothetical protein